MKNSENQRYSFLNTKTKNKKLQRIYFSFMLNCHEIQFSSTYWFHFIPALTFMIYDAPINEKTGQYLRMKSFLPRINVLIPRTEFPVNIITMVQPPFTWNQRSSPLLPGTKGPAPFYLELKVQPLFTWN